MAMYDYTPNIIKALLDQTGYCFSMNQVFREYLSHPDKHSLSSITDTLYNLNIDYKALYVEKNDIEKIKNPFISLIEENGSEVIVLVIPLKGKKYKLYYDKDEQKIITIDSFINQYRFVVICVDDIKSGYLAGYYRLFILSLLIISFMILLFNANFSYNLIIYYFLCLIGFVTSILINTYHLGLNENLLNRICNFTKISDCKEVIFSTKSKVTSFFNYSDIGIIYFSVQLFIIIFQNENISSIFYMSIVAGNFSLYSFYQQAFILKKFCTLCLIIALVLLIQSLLAIISFNQLSFNLINIAQAASIIIICTFIWLYLKEVIKNSSKLLKSEIDLLTIKRNYHFFIPYYQTLVPINIFSKFNDDGFYIGSKDAKVLITFITDPLCKFCTSAFKDLIRMQREYRNDIKLEIVFNVPVENANELRTKIALYFLHLNSIDNEYAIKVITQWYLDKNKVEIINTLNMQNSLDSYISILKIMRKSCIQSNIYATPLTIINGKQIPQFFSTNDLYFHIPAIIEIEKNK
jgi:uncharacterized membrane protein/vacuolar-type H+-ATPase subunit F/Vma7